MNREALYIFLHIPKTAGTVLTRNFQMHFKPEECLELSASSMGAEFFNSLTAGIWNKEKAHEYAVARLRPGVKFISGHMSYFGMHEYASRECRSFYLTFLRDPAERIISLYYYLRDLGAADYWGNEILTQGWSLEEWLEKSKMTARQNGQVQHILRNSRFEILSSDQLTRECVREAEKILEKFWFVGITENFSEDSYYLYGKAGLWRPYPQNTVRKTAGKEKISGSFRKRLIEQNEFDFELYEFAKKLRASFIRTRRIRYFFMKQKALFSRGLARKARVLKNSVFCREKPCETI